MCKGFLVHYGPVNIDGIKYWTYITIFPVKNLLFQSMLIKYWTYITLLSMNIKSSCVVFGEKTRESHTDKSSILQSSGWPNIFFWLSINSKILFLKKKTKKNQVFQENPMKNRNKINLRRIRRMSLRKIFSIQCHSS